VGDEAGPGAGDDGEKLVAIKKPLIDPPGYGVGKESGA
jgi:hypothetical protein